MSVVSTSNLQRVLGAEDGGVVHLRRLPSGRETARSTQVQHTQHRLQNLRPAAALKRLVQDNVPLSGQALLREKPPNEGRIARTLVTLLLDASAPILIHHALACVRSLGLRGGGISDAFVLIVVKGFVPDKVRREFELMGATVRVTSGLIRGKPPGSTPHCNKLLALDQPEARDVDRFDTVLYVDCDILFLEDPTPFLKSIQAREIGMRTGDVDWADLVFADPVWPRLARAAGMSEDHITKRPLGWPNTGVLVLSTHRVPQLLEKWQYFNLQTGIWIQQFTHELRQKASVYFVDTLAFIFAVHALAKDDGIPVSQLAIKLPIQMNCQLNWPSRAWYRNNFDLHLELYPAVLVQHNQGTLDLFPNGTFRLLDEAQSAAFPFLRSLNVQLSKLNQAISDFLTPGYQCGEQ